MTDLPPPWHLEVQLEGNPDVPSPPKVWHSKRNMTRPGLPDNLSKRQAQRNPAITFTQFSIKSNIMFLIHNCCIVSPACFYCQGIYKEDLLRGRLQGSVILFLGPQHSNGTALTWINPPAFICVLWERTSVVRRLCINHRVQQQPRNKAQISTPLLQQHTDNFTHWRKSSFLWDNAATNNSVLVYKSAEIECWGW